MKSFYLTKTELEDRGFGSPLDPLMHGVAQGLAKLFPPIENTRVPRSEDEAAHLHEADEERADD